MDLWKARSGDSFLSITARSINEKWVMNKRIITFSELEWPHTGQRIGSLILEKLQEYNILE